MEAFACSFVCSFVRPFIVARHCIFRSSTERYCGRPMERRWATSFARWRSHHIRTRWNRRNRCTRRAIYFEIAGLSLPLTPICYLYQFAIFSCAHAFPKPWARCVASAIIRWKPNWNARSRSTRMPRAKREKAKRILRCRARYRLRTAWKRNR